MKLVFLGTRGNIEARTARHRRHSSLLVSYYRKQVMIDCGEDWTDQIMDMSVQAVFITHAHPDHAHGLQHGAPCPVYATQEAWSDMEGFPIAERKIVPAYAPVHAAGMVFKAFPVIHSTHAPAIGYRVRAGKTAVFYVPDVVYIEDRARALQGVALYIGDGATMHRSMVRKIKGILVGHSPVTTQLSWCKKENVPGALFTHCGSGIVKGDERTLNSRLRGFARERSVNARIAYDGMEIVLR